MTDIMDWKYCEESFIRQVEADEEKVVSVIETAEARLKYQKGFAPKTTSASFPTFTTPARNMKQKLT